MIRLGIEALRRQQRRRVGRRVGIERRRRRGRDREIDAAVGAEARAATRRVGGAARERRAAPHHARRSQRQRRAVRPAARQLVERRLVDHQVRGAVGEVGAPFVEVRLRFIVDPRRRGLGQEGRHRRLQVGVDDRRVGKPHVVGAQRIRPRDVGIDGQLLVEDPFGRRVRRRIRARGQHRVVPEPERAIEQALRADVEHRRRVHPVRGLGAILVWALAVPRGHQNVPGLDPHLVEVHPDLRHHVRGRLPFAERRNDLQRGGTVRRRRQDLIRADPLRISRRDRDGGARGQRGPDIEQRPELGALVDLALRATPDHPDQERRGARARSPHRFDPRDRRMTSLTICQRSFRNPGVNCWQRRAPPRQQTIPERGALVICAGQEPALGSSAGSASPFYGRSDLKPTRSSSVRNCGCSQAAKCPPLGSLL